MFMGFVAHSDSIRPWATTPSSRHALRRRQDCDVEGMPDQSHWQWQRSQPTPRHELVELMAVAKHGSTAIMATTSAPAGKPAPGVTSGRPIPG
jgi:hypothetical protein